VYISFMTK